MARVLLTSLADADVADIIADIGAKAGRRTAEKYVAEFDRLFMRLGEYPLSGAPRTTLGPSVRIALLRPYVVIYDFDRSRDAVTVLRVLHGRREMTRRMPPFR